MTAIILSSSNSALLSFTKYILLQNRVGCNTFPVFIMAKIIREKKRLYYTAQMLQDETFMQFPKWLMLDPEFSKLSNDAKVLYTLLKDRFKLSLKNNWIDKEGRVFVICRRDSMQQLLNKSKNTIAKIVGELVKYNLIEDKQNGLTKPNYIYLLMPELSETKEQEFEEDYYIEPLEYTDSQILGFRNPGFYDSEESLFELQGSRDLSTNNNNSNNTNYNNIDDVKQELANKIIDESASNQLRIIEASNYNQEVINNTNKTRELIETSIASLKSEDVSLLIGTDKNISLKLWQKAFELIENKDRGVVDKEAYYSVILNNTVSKLRIDGRKK